MSHRNLRDDHKTKKIGKFAFNFQWNNIFKMSENREWFDSN